MNILRQLMEKPWEHPGVPKLVPNGGPSFASSAETVALRMFLCVVSVLFSLLVVVYSERMLYEDWRPRPQQWLLWMNTALLVVSSAAFQWSLISVRRSRLDEARAASAAAGLFAVAFLVGQILAWRQLNAIPVFDITNPAIAFFYLITALHALHLVGGLFVWGRITAALWHRADSAGITPLVRLCATYWHFLLGVWLVLFGLLFSGNDNLAALLAICGLR